MSVFLPNFCLEVCRHGLHAYPYLAVRSQLLPDLLAGGEDLGLIADQLLVQASKINYQAKCQGDSSWLFNEMGWFTLLAPAVSTPLYDSLVEQVLN